MSGAAAAGTRRAALILALLAAEPLQAAEFNFCWRGANGYTLTGIIGFADRHMTRPVITEREVDRFRITGFLHGVEIGAWDIATRSPGATWHLRFWPDSLTFPTGGSFPGEQSQGWNANGEVTDCGRRGFGFNSGNYAQDVCLNGVWVSQSSIPPDVPLRAIRGPVTPECDATEFLGKGPARR